jgi:hypothetical protein
MYKVLGIRLYSFTSEPTYRWVQINEDGTGNVFAAGGFGEESIVGTICGLGVGEFLLEMSIGGEAVLEEVSVQLVRMMPDDH